jgi:hypothetical protein
MPSDTGEQFSRLSLCEAKHRPCGTITCIFPGRNIMQIYEYPNYLNTTTNNKLIKTNGSLFQRSLPSLTVCM